MCPLWEEADVTMGILTKNVSLVIHAGAACQLLTPGAANGARLHYRLPEEQNVNAKLRSAVAAFVLILALLSPVAAQKNSAQNWPSFRGPDARGVADGFPLPATWDATAGKGVLWATLIPGLGHCSPIIWEDRIFLATAVSGIANPELKVGLYGDIASVNDNSTHRWIIYSLDRKSGKILWEKTAYTGVPKVKRHPKSTHASSTLATDGKHVVAFFGSEGLFCFDVNGKDIWKKDFGRLDSAYYVAPDAQWEFGSSPVIHKDMVLIQCDVLKGSFVAALSVNDGKEIWRTAREDVPTWGTPTVFEGKNAAQMIVNGYREVAGYDLKTGKEVWRMKGGGDIPVPTPVVAGDMAFITNAHGSLAPVIAIHLNATGDISLKGDETSNQYVAWSYPRDGAYMSTPVVYGDYLYNCRWNGILICYEAKTGKKIYQERLGNGTSGFSASPVAGDNKVYLPSEDGDVYVVEHGPAFKLIAKNPMGGALMATPAISSGIMYFRTQSQLIAIGK
jgi:outer membrane protein assembly factor BamB